MHSFPDRLVFRLQDATAGNNKRGTGLVHQGGVGGKDDAALLPSFSLEPRAAGAEPAGLIGNSRGDRFGELSHCDPQGRRSRAPLDEFHGPFGGQPLIVFDRGHDTVFQSLQFLRPHLGF